MSASRSDSVLSPDVRDKCGQATIAAACFAVLLPRDDAFPFTRAERVMALAMVDFWFVTCHFAAQHFGVLSLYRVRSRRTADPWIRRLDRLFALGVGGALVVVAEAVAGTTLFQHVWEGTWLDMEWLAGASGMSRVVATALVLALTLALLGSEARASNVSLPRVLYAVGMAVMVYIGLHTDRPFLFVAVWTAQHWLAATALATRVGRLPAVPPGCSDRGTRALPGTKPGSDLLALATGCDTTLQRMRR